MLTEAAKFVSARLPLSPVILELKLLISVLL